MRTVLVGTVVVVATFVVAATTSWWNWAEALGICVAAIGGVLIGCWLRQDRDRDYEEWRNRWH